VQPSRSSASTDPVRVRRPTEGDHARVLAVMEQWWGGHGGADGARYRASLLPRLFFQHFTATSSIVEHPDGRLAAFLIGFVSPSEPGTAYVHFVGVDPNARRGGLAGVLYQRFFRDAARLGARRIKAITSPTNTTSVAFHAALGFAVSPVHPDYDGPDNDRVCFTRDVTSAEGELLRQLSPRLNPGAYVFATANDPLPHDAQAIVTVREDEGLTVVLPQERADALGLSSTFVAAWITLQVHSALDAVGLTAAVSRALAEASISANVVAGFHHDHVFVPHREAEQALRILRDLAGDRDASVSAPSGSE
jgi:GNAT superfamily N-acetyltransferase